MTQTDYRRCTTTLPKIGVIVDALLVGDEIEIRQGNQTIRIPGLGEGMQEVLDALITANQALGRARKTSASYLKQPEKIEQDS